MPDDFDKFEEAFGGGETAEAAPTPTTFEDFESQFGEPSVDPTIKKRELLTKAFGGDKTPSGLIISSRPEEEISPATGQPRGDAARVEMERLLDRDLEGLIPLANQIVERARNQYSEDGRLDEFGAPAPPHLDPYLQRLEPGDLTSPALNVSTVEEAADLIASSREFSAKSQEAMLGAGLDRAKVAAANTSLGLLSGATAGLVDADTFGMDEADKALLDQELESRGEAGRAGQTAAQIGGALIGFGAATKAAGAGLSAAGVPQAASSKIAPVVSAAAFGGASTRSVEGAVRGAAGAAIGRVAGDKVLGGLSDKVPPRVASAAAEAVEEAATLPLLADTDADPMQEVGIAAGLGAILGGSRGARSERQRQRRAREKSRAGERGFAAGEAVGTSIGGIREIAGNLSDEFRELRSRLQRKGPVGAEVTSKIDVGIEQANEYRGHVKSAYDKALVSTMGDLSAKHPKSRAVTALQKPFVDKETGVLLDPLTEMIEGRMKPRTLWERKIVQDLKRYQTASWREKYKIGMERQIEVARSTPEGEKLAAKRTPPAVPKIKSSDFDPSAGTLRRNRRRNEREAEQRDRDIVRSGGKPRKFVRWARIPEKAPPVHPRIFTPDIFVAFRGGAHEFRQAVVDAVAKLNKWTPEQAEAWGKRMDRDFMGMESLEAITQAESVREVSRMPGAIKFRGRTIPILEGNPHKWLKRFHNVSASAYGRRQAFGQGSTDTIPKLREKYADEAGVTDMAMTDAMRAFQELPVADPILTRGTAGGELARFGQGLLSVARSGRLSGAMAGNTIEIIQGAQNDFGRMFDTARALRDLATGKTTSRGLEAGGFKTKDVPDLTTSPHDKQVTGLRKVSSIMREFVSRPLEEATETVAAARAKVVADRIRKSGRVSSRDLADARAIGMSDADARKWMKGDLSAEEAQRVADNFRQRMVTSTTTANQNPAQMSRFEHRRYVKALAAFTRWASAQVRMTGKRIQVASDMTAEAVRGKTREGHVLKGAERTRHAAAGIQRLAKHAFGKGLSGTANTLIASYIMQGPEAAEMRWNEFKEEPVKKFFEAAFAQSVSGVYSGAAQVMAGEDAGNIVARNLFPYQVAKGVVDTFRPSKFGGDVAFLERLGKFVETTVPISRVLTEGAASSMFGNNKARRTYDAAKRSYYRFLRDEGVDFGTREPTEFSSKMRRAADLIERGEPTEVWRPKVMEALKAGEKSGKAASQSLLARRFQVHKWKPERLERFRRIVGEDGLRALQVRDALLTSVARSK